MKYSLKDEMVPQSQYSPGPVQDEEYLLRGGFHPLALVAWPTISVYPRLPSYLAVDACEHPCAAECANLPSCGSVPLQCASVLGCGVPPVLPSTPPTITTKPVHCGPFVAYV